MADEPKTIMTDDEAKAGYAGDEGVKHDHPAHHGLAERVRHSISVQSIDENTKEGQIFSMNDVDPALDAKMRLVNNVSFGCLWLPSVLSLARADRNVGWWT
jgi:hypothetical protein